MKKRLIVSTLLVIAILALMLSPAWLPGASPPTADSAPVVTSSNGATLGLQTAYILPSTATNTGQQIAFMAGITILTALAVLGIRKFINHAATRPALNNAITSGKQILNCP